MWIYLDAYDDLKVVCTLSHWRSFDCETRYKSINLCSSKLNTRIEPL